MSFSNQLFFTFLFFDGADNQREEKANTYSHPLIGRSADRASLSLTA
jgi:hypothetical protein